MHKGILDDVVNKVEVLILWCAWDVNSLLFILFEESYHRFTEGRDCGAVSLLH